MPIARPVVAVVEDDDGMRKSIERLLAATGYAPRTFSSAQEYLESATGNPAALVLDVHLPAISGLELHRRLLAAGSRVPVVFITAFDQEETRAEAQGLGCVAYLRKPFKPEALAAAILRCIQASPRPGT